MDQRRLQDLLEDSALAQESMDVSRVRRVREEMERAEARRLQLHYVESFSWKRSSAWAGPCGSESHADTRSPTFPPQCASGARLMGEPGTRGAALRTDCL